MTENLLNHRAEGPASAPPLLLGPSLGHLVRPVGQGRARTVRRPPGDPLGPARTRRFARRTDRSAARPSATSPAWCSRSPTRWAWSGSPTPGCRSAARSACTSRCTTRERVSSLAVICSSAHFDGLEPWQERAALVRRGGRRSALAESADARWFTPGFTVPELVADQRRRRPGGVRRLLRRAGRLRPARPSSPEISARDAADRRPRGPGDPARASAGDRGRGAGRRAGGARRAPRTWPPPSARRPC